MTTEAGIVYLPNRWSGDTHSDKDTGCVDVEATEQLIAKQAAELKRLHDYDTRLTAVMPADFKDWHENSNKEWPEIAAWVITSLREREDDAWRHAELLSIRLYRSETSLRLMEKTCNKLDDTIEVEDTLLRQALEALEKTRAFHQQDWSSEEITPKLTRDTITAIKQHLGEDHGN